MAGFREETSLLPVIGWQGGRWMPWLAHLRQASPPSPASLSRCRGVPRRGCRVRRTLGVEVFLKNIYLFGGIRS